MFKSIHTITCNYFETENILLIINRLKQISYNIISRTYKANDKHACTFKIWSQTSGHCNTLDLN